MFRDPIWWYSAQHGCMYIDICSALWGLTAVRPPAPFKGWQAIVTAAYKKEIAKQQKRMAVAVQQAAEYNKQAAEYTKQAAEYNKQAAEHTKQAATYKKRIAEFEQERSSERALLSGGLARAPKRKR